MIVVIELDTYSLKYENVLSIGRALLEKGVDVKMWNPAQTSFHDMVYELEPDIVFYTSDRTVPNRARLRVQKDRPNIELVCTDIYKTTVIADTISFKKLNKHPMLNGQVCLLQYPEIESVNDIILKQRMSVKFTDRFRLFSIEKTSGAKFCGWLPKELHPLIFSSADSVLALSKHTAVNASLCNDDVQIVENGLTKKFSITSEEIEYLSNETIANRILDNHATVQSS